jgi:hypothetical protein
LILFCCLLYLFIFFHKTIDHSSPPARPHDSSPPPGEIGGPKEVEIEIERGRRSGDGGGLLYGDFCSFLVLFVGRRSWWFLVLFVGDGDEGLRSLRESDFNFGLDFMGGGRGRFCRPLKKFPARAKKKKEVSGEDEKQSIASDGIKKKSNEKNSGR